jgi:small conductance mechanosensitive channel
MRRMLIVVSLLVLNLATPAFSQEGPATSAPSQEGSNTELIAEARDLLAGIERDVAALDELQTQPKAAGSEEQALLELRRARASEDVLAKINEFVAAVVELEQNGSEVPELHQAAEKFVLRIDPLARKRIGELKAEIAALGGQRDKAEGDARDRIEAKIARRDELLRKAFQATFQNVRNMQALGLDSTEARARFGESVTNRAEDTLSRLEISEGKVASLKAQVATNPEDAAGKVALDAEEAIKAVAVTDLTAAIDMMTELKLDATKYKQALIQSTGEISTDILDPRVVYGLVRRWFAALEKQVVENGPGWAFKLLVICGILLLFHLLGRLVQGIVRRGLTASKLRLSQILSDTIVATSGNLVRILGLLIALSQVGFALGPLLAGFGIAGFIAGFALQETLANFASGVMILIYRPFDIGDTVEAGGASGVVSAMSMVSTRILTDDNQALVVPNGKIWGDVIKNLTVEKTRRVDLSFRVHHDENVEKIEKLLGDIVNSHPKVLKDPAPIVKLNALADASLEFVVRSWVKTEDYWEAYWDLTRAVKLRFDQESIRAALPSFPALSREVASIPGP